MADDSEEYSSRRANVLRAFVLSNPGEDESTIAEVVDYTLAVWRQSETLYRSHLFIPSVDHLEGALLCAEEIVSIAGPASICAPDFAYNLARPLLRRFQHSRQDEDLLKAIELLREAYRVLPDDDCRRQKCFGYLSIAYMERDRNYEGFIRDLELDVNIDGFISELDRDASHNSQARTSTSHLQVCQTAFRDIHEKERDEVFDYFWKTFVREYTSHFDEFNGSAPTLLKALNAGLEIYRYALSFFCSDIGKVAEILVMPNM